MPKLFDIPTAQLPGPGDWAPPEDDAYGDCDHCGADTYNLVAIEHDGDRPYAIFVCDDCTDL